jgi:hypothetical protein
MQIYVIQSDTGLRVWQAEDVAHAIDQHDDAFPEERFVGISVAVKASSEYPAAASEPYYDRNDLNTSTPPGEYRAWND